MRITLDRNSSTPLSKQICIRIRELILSGELKNGERLPSTRIMAKELKINRATVAQAYKELIHEGLVHSGVGSGTYISYHAFDNHDELDQSNYIPQLSEGIHSLWRTSMEGLDFKLVPEDTVNFATLIPDENFFPIDEFTECLNQTMKDEGPSILQYSGTLGYPPLREFLVERLKNQNINRFLDSIIHPSVEDLDS